ncbi:MAG: hypothetical protein KAY22_23955, partial [Rhizorhabdus sp.]|uniref:hypothetical protein n=1 Tax=Rhizorhabdus sp. TaxID=1968843 RepID=UPI001B41D513
DNTLDRQFDVAAPCETPKKLTISVKLCHFAAHIVNFQQTVSNAEVDRAPSGPCALFGHRFTVAV